MKKLSLSSAAQARDALQGLALPGGVETVSLAQAVARHIATDVVGLHALPASPRAAMDGFAIRAADVAAAAASSPVDLPIVGAVVAGAIWPQPLLPGQTVRIPTGGCLPVGADTVVPFELVEEGSGSPEQQRQPLLTACFLAPVETGRHVVPIGQDVDLGQKLIDHGTWLAPRHVGVLAALGHVHVAVHLRPRLYVLSSGAEVCDPEAEPTPAQVRDVNQLLLGHMASQLGAEVKHGGIIADDPMALADALRAAVADHDVVVLSAGTSVGVRDFAGQVISALPGARLLFHGLAIRPGKPTLAALVEVDDRRCFVFGLPGFPVSASVAFSLFVAPVLRRLQGARGWPVWGHTRQANLARTYASALGREDYVRVQLDVPPHDAEALPQAFPVAAGPALVTGLLQAEGYVVVPPEVSEVSAGARVEVLSPCTGPL